MPFTVARVEREKHVEVERMLHEMRLVQFNVKLRFFRKRRKQENSYKTFSFRSHMKQWLQSFILLVTPTKKERQRERERTD